MALLLAVLGCSVVYFTVLAPPSNTTYAEVPNDAATILPLWTPTPTAPPPTAVPTATPEIVPTPVPLRTLPAPVIYYAQAGDSLPVLAIRFGVSAAEITSPDPILSTELLNPGQRLLMPARLKNTTSSKQLIPDSEVVYSPSAVGFDIKSYINQSGGYLSHYTEYLGSTGNTSGADIIRRVALENSINPRLLLALIDYQSHWVTGQPRSLAETKYPLGLIDASQATLYKQLTWAVVTMSQGYYGWREGLVTGLTFTDLTNLRLAPDLNAGTVALLYLFANLGDQQSWSKALYSPDSLVSLHEKMYGSPWLRAQTVEPLFPATLTQPDLMLPFQINTVWAFTGGPHPAWEPGGARAALDFAPGSEAPGCLKSYAWVVASATGLVVRSERGVVMLDLDGDGHEQTGWDILYLHIENIDRVPVGTWVAEGDKIGHPSCEGGIATGTHVHMARKYNGEWMLADGPVPFVLSGYQAHGGKKDYEGYLTKGDQKIFAVPNGALDTQIRRTELNPNGS
jgi:LasA protease